MLIYIGMGVILKYVQMLSICIYVILIIYVFVPC